MFRSIVTKSITSVITDKDTENVNVCKIMLVLLVREGQRFCIIINIDLYHLEFVLTVCKVSFNYFIQGNICFCYIFAPLALLVTF